MTFNGTISGMFRAIQNPEYQNHLDTQVGQILGNNESISLDALKKNSIFEKAYKELDAKGKERVDYIAGLEGDSQNVSERELKVILTALDANLRDGTKYFSMDGKPSTGETGGLNKAYDTELQDILKNTKTRAERKMEEQKKQKIRNENIKTTVEQAKDIKPYDNNGRVNGGEWAKAIQIIHQNISWGNREGYEDWFNAFEKILGKGQINRQASSRKGYSNEWVLNNGTKVYLDTGLGSESDYVTVTHPDGTTEKFKPDGTKVE